MNRMRPLDVNNTRHRGAGVGSAGARVGVTGWPAPFHRNHVPLTSQQPGQVESLEAASSGQRQYQAASVGAPVHHEPQQLGWNQQYFGVQQMQHGGMENLYSVVDAKQKLWQTGKLGQAQVGFQHSGFTGTPMGTTRKSVRPAKAFNVKTRGGATIARGPQYAVHGKIRSQNGVAETAWGL